MNDELLTEQTTKSEESLLAEGYIKVQRTQQLADGTELIKSPPRFYLPGSKELKADIAEAIENWKDMWVDDFQIDYIDLNATVGTLLELSIRQEALANYETWEII